VRITKQIPISSIAVKRDGSLWMWGNEIEDFLNPSSLENFPVPVQVNRDAVWLSIGGWKEVLRTTDHKGRVWVWGNQVVNPDLGVLPNDAPFPVQVAPGNDWFTICAEQHFVIGLRSNGALWAWGARGDGVLGRAGQSGTFGNLSPGPVDGGAVWLLP